MWRRSEENVERVGETGVQVSPIVNFFRCPVGNGSAHELFLVFLVIPFRAAGQPMTYC